MTTGMPMTTYDPELVELATILLKLILPDGASYEDFDESLNEFLDLLIKRTFNYFISLFKFFTARNLS